VKNKGTKIVTGIVVVLIIVVAVCVWLCDPFRSKNAVAISLVCTTNDPSLGPVAIFCVTNQSDLETEYLPFLAQIRNHGTWERFHDWSNDFCELGPHMTATVNVPITTNCEAWRFPVWWSYINNTKSDSLRTWLIGNVHQNWWFLMRGKPLHYYDRIGVENTAFSETITNK
jgi:hypothetical protein